MNAFFKGFKSMANLEGAGMLAAIVVGLALILLVVPQFAPEPLSQRIRSVL